jgi:hypothetical protein
MAINPSTEFSGQINAPDANYTYGSARNDTVSGDRLGTPWVAALVNDIFGFQQALLKEAAIVPSGSPETQLVSQYLDAVRKITNTRAKPHNITSDANYTLTAEQNKYRRVMITDTGVILSAARDIIVDDTERRLLLVNGTAEILTFKTAAGTGVAVSPGDTVDAICDGTDVDYAVNTLGGFSLDQVLVVAEVQTSGTSGGIVSATATWLTRVLNTAVVNTIPGASLNATTYEVTLPAGTYDFEGSAPAEQCNSHKTRVYNVTAAAEVSTVFGSTENGSSAANVTTRSFISGTATFSVETKIRLEQIFETAGELGNPGSFTGVDEGYSFVKIKKIG